MVALSDVEASNARLSTSLPAGLVAVFVGATSGIGEYALKAFAQQTVSPRIYFVGRSQDAATRIIAESKEINPHGEYTFIKSDVALLKNVDDVCQKILAKEGSINLLFQTQGTMLLDKTSEGLSHVYVLPVTSRILFALNLLPAIQKANNLKRVVSVFAAGYEGEFDDSDWSGFASKKPMKGRPHVASMVTMANNILARQAPDVSFVHNYPGAVKTPFGKDAKGTMAVVRTVFNLLGHVLIKYLPPKDCGNLQLYGATSARFPPAAGDAAGVSMPNQTVAKGTDGKPASGSYAIDANCEHVSTEVEQHLAKARTSGAEDKMWSHILAEIEQITGKAR